MSCLLVGLGNPGSEYKYTRHNIGFLIIDKIKTTYEFPDYKEKFDGVFSCNSLFNEKLILFKPMLYMNNSGISVQKIKNYFNINKENMLIFHDDLDMVTGKIRLKFNGRDGGHNGIKDIIEKIGSNFRRLKMGIGKNGKLENSKMYVLKNFNKNEKNIIDIKINNVVDNLEHLVFKNYDKFNNEIKNGI